MFRWLIILLLIVGCERYEDRGKQRPNFGEYETRFDKWTNSIQYNVNGEWLTIEEYKKTEYYQSKWSEVEKNRKKENTVQKNISKFRNQLKILNDIHQRVQNPYNAQYDVHNFIHHFCSP